MPRFAPFPGIRYDPARVDLAEVTAPPYDVLTGEERAALAARHPANIVHVDVPVEADGPGRYDAAAATLQRWLADATLVVDTVPALYLYRMTYADEHGRPRHTTGVLGALEVVDAGDPAPGVLPHERTTPKARSDRLDLTRATRANLSPVWGLSLAAGLTDLLAPPATVLAEWRDDCDIVHRLERVDDPARTAAIAERVANDAVVIADGHHRYEVARLYRNERRQGGGPGAYDDTLALVVELTEDELHVQAIHRLLSGVGPGLEAHLAHTFEVAEAGPLGPDVLDAMAARGALCLVRPDGTGAFLRPRPEALTGVDDLDSARLDAGLAGFDCSLRFQHGAGAVVDAVASGQADAGVLLRPVTVAQIEAMARRRALMPPKSTFFAPKPLTGLVVRSVA